MPEPKGTDKADSGIIKAHFGSPISSEEAPPLNSVTRVSAQERAASPEPAQILLLTEAIETAYRQQPRLRVFLESVDQPRRGEDIAFAPFMPIALAGGSVGGFNLNAGGNTPPLGAPPGFTFLPALGSIPFGLNIDTGYELAEFKLQWLICDFGRRLGRY